MAHSCWLKTQDGTVGPSRSVLDYFVSHTAIIKTPRHNLFTARRLSVGSSHLSPRNNCCDDRLCWEHVQACENMHHFRLEGLESQPSWCDRKSDIFLFRSSNQFLLWAVWCSMSKDSMLFFFNTYLISILHLELCQNATLRDLNTVISILHSAQVWSTGIPSNG